MAKIKQLPPHEAQKIAAGEVVERPANVVKELIENALDAGATEITLYLEDGGRKLIRIVDNGFGMSEEDARLSIKHHATSKITGIHDLEHIQTFGFRGEALSSIASVSRMTLATKQSTDITGITLEIQETNIIKESPNGMNPGTDIAIRDLFFNVPARQKFLKTKETEWRAIVHLFQALCLAYQNVSFKLYHDDRMVYALPATSQLKERVGQLFEPAFSKNMFSFDGNLDRMNVQITGIGTGPQYTRFDRSHIFVFVQRRWVKNHKLIQAFIKGYQGMLQPNRYPAGVLFIALDPQSVDINIHPRKEEVQFLHPRIIEDLIGEQVKKALENAQALVPLSSVPKSRALSDSLQDNRNTRVELIRPAVFMKEQQPIVPLHVIEQSMPTPPESKNEDFLSALTPFNRIPEGGVEEAGTHSIRSSEPLSYRLIGQMKKTYIVIETGEGLVLIDQHAAHERILYERFRARFDDVARVRLLFPQIISLADADLALIEPYLPLFQTFGIEVQRLEKEIVITETPVLLNNQSLEDSIKQAVSVLYEYEYLERDELKKIIHERIHASVSCKAAVKAGDELSVESMHEIIKDLSVTENRLTCPHGRPTRWELKIDEIEKRFKRDYRQ